MKGYMTTKETIIDAYSVSGMYTHRGYLIQRFLHLSHTHLLSQFHVNYPIYNPSPQLCLNDNSHPFVGQTYDIFHKHTDCNRSL